MKSHFYPSLALFLCLNLSLSGQFYNEPFDTGLNGWGSLGFEFDDNGAAENFSGWNNRSRIRSASLGGSLTFAGTGTDARVTSPAITVPGSVNNELYLSFYQYFGSNGGTPRVLVTGDNGLSLDTILQIGLTADEETSAGSYHLISLGNALQGPGEVTVQFELVGGAADFWILDDVQLYQSRPTPVTFPRYVGESLTQFGKPFVVDSAGAPAVPFQLVVDWLPNLTEVQKQSFRDMYNPVVLQSCACDRLEVWEMPGGIFFDPATGEPLGDPLDILSVTLPSSGMNKVDGLDLNYYVYNDLELIPDTPNSPLTNAEVSAFSSAPADAVRVAILDTGLDLDHPEVNGFIFRDADNLDGTDTDNDCLVDNPLGWNYVDNNNNPDDDNGHGTHVTGIIASNAEDCNGCTIQLLPYKTHDSYGVGTLFAASCAILQAGVYDDADVINCSWGFYGGGDDGVLRTAIDTAASYGALVVAAAGNDSLNLVADPQFPALYSLNNILAVGAHDTLPIGSRPYAGFSNYSAADIEIAAFGVDVNSSLLEGTYGYKSGTSMAAPLVAAAASMYHCEYPWQVATARSFILENAFVEPGLTGVVLDGNTLDLSIFCQGDKSIGERPASDISIDLVAGGDVVEVVALQGLAATEITITSADGNLMEERSLNQLPEGTKETFDLSAAASGQYLVVVQTSGRVYTQRLVKR
ncbi:MAG: S8 family peptidase [Lewinella sp.]